MKVVARKLANNRARLQTSLAYKLETLTEKNDDVICEVCDTQTNFIKGQIQKTT